MVTWKPSIKWQRKTKDLYKTDSQSIHLESKALEIRFPFGGFVWNTPSAVLIQGEDYQDRQIIRSIFKILINKVENRVSLTELASRMRVWRGELGERIEYLAEETDFINIEVDRRGEVWYSI